MNERRTQILNLIKSTDYPNTVIARELIDTSPDFADDNVNVLRQYVSAIRKEFETDEQAMDYFQIRKKDE